MEQINESASHKDLDQIAGYHDGRHIFISGKHDDAYVSFHELVHDRIFKTFLDGQILAVFTEMTESVNFIDKKANLDRIVKFLWRDSLLAQERSATYLGVQHLSLPEKRTQILHLFDHEYVNYFRFFSEMIDGITDSSYVRYATAWAVTGWAFSSIRAQILPSRWIDIDSYIAIDGPTARMDAWEARGIDSCHAWVAESASLVANRFDLNIADLHHDKYWDSLAPKDLRYLDNQLGACLSSTIFKYVDAPTCDLKLPNTNFYLAATNSGIEFKFQDKIHLPRSTSDYSQDLEDGRILSNARLGDSIKVFGSSLSDWMQLTKEELHDKILQIIGARAQFSIVVRSRSDAYLFICQKDESSNNIGNKSYKIYPSDINSILEIIIKYYEGSQFYLPIMLCYDFNYCLDVEFSTIINSLPEKVELASLPNDYKDEFVDKIYVCFHAYIAGNFSDVLNTFQGTLEFGVVNLIDSGGKNISVDCSIFIPSANDSFKLIGLHPRMSKYYRDEFINYLQLAKKIDVTRLDYRSIAMLQLIHSAWAVFAK